MEINNLIIGSRLHEIQKRPDEVKLVFGNSNSPKAYVLTFRGLLFETPGILLNKKVKNIQLDNRLGFRALSHLRLLDRDPKNYKQLFIQMEGSDEDNKLELIGAIRNYKILSPNKERTSPAQRSVKSIAQRRTKVTIA